MKPYFESDNIVIYNDDCRAVLPRLDTADLLLTDPPYGVLPEKWDKFSEQGFNIFNAQWMGLCAELADTALIFTGNTRTNISDMLKMFYKNTRLLIWDKGSGSTGDGPFWFCFEGMYLCDNSEPVEFVPPKFQGVAKCITNARRAAGVSRGAVDLAVRGKKTGLCYRWEEGACLPTQQQEEILQAMLGIYDFGYCGAMKAAVAAKEETLENMREYNSVTGARYSDVLRFPVKKVTDHPCEKPVSLIIRLLQGLTGTTIIDPFMGTGAILVAAKEMGRKCIGIEENEKYCEQAALRLEQNYFNLDVT